MVPVDMPARPARIAAFRSLSPEPLMPDWTRLSAADEIPVGEGREFTVGDRIVALFRVGEGDEFHAVDGICLHAGGPIAQGALSGCVVTCPWHGWQYDVQTGQHCLTPRLKLDSFPVRVVDGQVEIDLGSGPAS